MSNKLCRITNFNPFAIVKRFQVIDYTKTVSFALFDGAFLQFAKETCQEGSFDSVYMFDDVSTDADSMNSLTALLCARFDRSVTRVSITDLRISIFGKPSVSYNYSRYHLCEKINVAERFAIIFHSSLTDMQKVATRKLKH